MERLGLRPMIEEAILDQEFPVGATLVVALPDELWTRVNIEFYSDPADGVFKALPD